MSGTRLQGNLQHLKCAKGVQINLVLHATALISTLAAAQPAQATIRLLIVCSIHSIIYDLYCRVDSGILLWGLYLMMIARSSLTYAFDCELRHDRQRPRVNLQAAIRLDEDPLQWIVVGTAVWSLTTVLAQRNPLRSPMRTQNMNADTCNIVVRLPRVSSLPRIHI